MSIKINNNELIENPCLLTIEKLNKKIEEYDITQSMMQQKIIELEKVKALMQLALEKKSLTKIKIIQDLALDKQKIRKVACKVNKENDELLYKNSELEYKNYDLNQKTKKFNKKEKIFIKSKHDLQELINEQEKKIFKKDKIISEMRAKLSDKNQKIRILEKKQKVPCDYLRGFRDSIIPFFKLIFTAKYCTNCAEQAQEVVHEIEEEASNVAQGYKIAKTVGKVTTKVIGKL